jgi:RNA polymerase sigma-70 factor (ECF subfamily)
VAGDESAFEALFQEMGERLFAFILRYLGDHHRAEDVYQAVLVKVACKAATFQAHAKATTWIFQIARNTCLDELRAENRRPKVLSSEPELSQGLGGSPLPGEAPEPAEELIHKELGSRIEQAIQSLPDEQREVFLLKEEGGLTFEEISAVTDCGRETCKSRMRYALERLRNGLTREAKQYGLQ